MKNLLIILFITILSCSKNYEPTITLEKVTKKNDFVELEIQNNTDNNCYIISPQLEIYTMGRASMLKTKIVSRTYKFEEMDSIICKVFHEQCKTAIEYDIFSSNYVVILPKKSSTKIVYQYDENYDEKDVKYSFNLGYNLNQYSLEREKSKLSNLKLLMDNKKLVTGSELYIEEIILNPKLLDKFYH